MRPGARYAPRQAADLSGDPAVCGGTCNGASGAQCDYAPTTKDCGTKCETNASVERTCDGKGACVAKDARSCAPFACDSAGKCRVTCAADAECAPGNRCATGSCVPTGGAKCIDTATSQTSDGRNVTCTPYNCDQTSGACAKICTDSALDCSAGYLCNANTKACEPVATPTDESSGGCATSRTRSSSALAAWALLALVATRRRARR